jgi:hypothetical protein
MRPFRVEGAHSRWNTHMLPRQSRAFVPALERWLNGRRWPKVRHYSPDELEVPRLINHRRPTSWHRKPASAADRTVRRNTRQDRDATQPTYWSSASQFFETISSLTMLSLSCCPLPSNQLLCSGAGNRDYLEHQHPAIVRLSRVLSYLTSDQVAARSGTTRMACLSAGQNTCKSHRCGPCRNS